ncbi:MAG: M50 family metallopeptidase [Candidatus Levyibacteriota bacterium]
MVITLIVFLLILSVLVLIHEAGHYFVAKKFGIKVEEFGFGFPLTPPLWQKQKGETIYSFYPVLIGGFVKLYGEDEAGGGRISGKDVKKNTDEHRAFYAKSLWQRLLVIVAGVVMNALLAAFIYYIFLGLSGFKQELPLIGNPPIIGSDTKIVNQIVITDVAENSPAAKAGITPLSSIESINGIKINQEDALTSFIKNNAGRPISITWKDANNRTHTATLIPRVNPPKNQGALGIAYDPNVDHSITLSYDTPTQKLFSGLVHPINLMSWNFTALGNLIAVSEREKSVQPIKGAVSGPIGIGFAVGSVVSIPDVKLRILTLLNLTGLLSISLAFMNVLPIPGLDGGRLLFIIIEAVTRRKMNPKVEGYINATGMVVLLALVALVSINDVQTHSQDIVNYFSHLFQR